MYTAYILAFHIGIITKKPLSAVTSYPAQGFLRNPKVRSHHAEWRP